MEQHQLNRLDLNYIEIIRLLSLAHIKTAKDSPVKKKEMCIKISPEKQRSFFSSDEAVLFS